MPDLPPLRCGGCRRCCEGDTIVLRPEKGDDVTAYRTNLIDGVRVLKKKGGNCIYLGPKGCRIYDRRPHDCRKFDCRAYFLRYENDPEGFHARLQTQAREAMLEGRRRVRAIRAASNPATPS